MNVRPTFALALMATLALGPVPAHADELLTLDQALQTAKERNLDLRAARQRIEQARTISGKVWANFLPRIAVAGSYTYNQYEAKLAMPTGYMIREIPGAGTQQPPANPDNPMMGRPTDYVMLPTGMAEVPIQLQHQLGAQLTIDQTLLAPALFPALSAASKALEAAELGVEAARREILFATAQLYYGVVGLKEAIRIQERLLEQAKAHEADAKVKFELGAVPKIALLRAQIDRARGEQDLLRSRNSYVGAKESLALLLDRKPDFEVALPAEPTAPTGDLEKQALKRPDVAAARTNEELARLNVTGGWMAYLPSLGLNGTYMGSNAKGFTGQNTSYFVRVGLQWTLWDGGLREANMREYGAQLEEAILTAESTEKKALNEVRQARLELESALANRSKAEEQAKLARENRELVEAAFRSGAATPVEVADAATALQGAELQALSESLNAQVAMLKLAKAAGAFDP